ncbi:transport permease protein [Alphaproteobacteria bacterium]|nr:transport permease protein [Alphaproteobacteria bacterium]
MLRELVKTDFKLRYEGSALGMLWSALRPLMMFGVMYVVFVHFLKFGADVPFFAPALLLGIVLWQFFAETTSQGMQSIYNNGGILRKIKLPKYVLVVSASVSALINLGINMVVVMIFALINGVTLGPSALLVIPLIIELYVFALAVSLILSGWYVKFRDIGHIWDVVLQAAYFATPIFWPLSMVMTASPLAAKALLMNPMAQMIQDARHALIYDGTDTVWTTFQNPLIMIIPILIVVVLAVLSVLYFRRASRRFTELV